MYNRLSGESLVYFPLKKPAGSRQDATNGCTLPAEGQRRREGAHGQGGKDEMLDLPDQALSLTAPLPPILPPPLQRLARAVAQDDEDEIEAALAVALPAYDSPLTRARMARTCSPPPWPRPSTQAPPGGAASASFRRH